MRNKRSIAGIFQVPVWDFSMLKSPSMVPSRPHGYFNSQLRERSGKVVMSLVAAKVLKMISPEWSESSSRAAY